MSLYPEDWRQYRWDAFSATGAGSFSNLVRRLWRITATTGGAAASISFAPSGASVSVPANTTYVLEPKGMFPAQASWGAFDRIVIETIGKDAG